jgi:Mrp family chromosome partitioning ATPase
VNRSTNHAANTSDATDPRFLAQVQLLRSRVEADLPKPAIILVTSAAGGDGKSLVAHSLADSFLRAGHRAALVHLTKGVAERSELPEIASARDAADAAADDRFEAMVTKMRAGYDFTVVDGRPLLQDGAAVSLAPLVDGILIAVRVGRPETAADALMMRTLKRAGARIVGVVAAEAQAIADSGRCADRGSTGSSRRAGP